MGRLDNNAEKRWLLRLRGWTEIDECSPPRNHLHVNPLGQVVDLCLGQSRWPVPEAHVDKHWFQHEPKLILALDQ